MKDSSRTNSELIEEISFLKQRIKELEKLESDHDRALVSSNIILRTQQESSIDGILVVDEKGYIVSFNQRFIDMWGIPPDVIETKSDESALQSVMEKLASPEEFIRRVKHLYEFRDEKSRDEIFLKDGRAFDRYSSPMLGADGNYYGRVWYFRDITDRKRADEALQASQERFKQIVENANELIWEVDSDGVYRYCSLAVERILGYSANELVGQKHFYDLFVPEVREELKDQAFAMFQRKKPFLSFINSNVHKNGSIVILETSGTPMLDKEENLLGYRGVVMDVTERQRLEEALMNDQIRMINDQNCLTAVMDSIDALVYVADFDSYEILFLNKYGRKKWGDLVGRRCWETIQKNQEGPCKFCTNNKLLSVTGVPTGVYRWEFQNTKNGRWYDCQDQAIRWIDGRLVRFEIATDITDRKQAELALKMSKDYLDNIINFTGYPIFVKDDSFRFTLINNALCDMLGMERKDIIGKTLGESLPKDQMDHFLKVDRMVLESGVENQCEELLTGRGGKVLNIVTKKMRYVDEQGNKFIVGVIHDITDRKKVEEALQESKLFLNSLLESIPVPVFYKDARGRYLGFNEAFQAFFGKTREELVGKSFFDIGSSELARVYHEKDVELFDRPGTQVYESQVNNAHQEIRDVVLHKASIKDSSGIVTGLIGVILDITDRKRAEEEIQKLFSEKELLLKEVHHRIKNHMNVIMSLLSLQSSTMKDPSAASSLLDVRSRVQSMMVLYDKLYRSSDFRTISTKEYLTSLIDEIIGNFRDRRQIESESQIDDISLDAKALSPIGMILNELLTNIMKHAFVGREDGLIRVSFSAKDNHATLIVQDNGIGIPESVDIGTSTGFGMQLVNILTAQFGGTIRVERENGTRFIMEFEV